MGYSRSHIPSRTLRIAYHTLPWAGYWDHTRNRLHHIRLGAQGLALSHLDHNRHEPGFLVFKAPFVKELSGVKRKTEDFSLIVLVPPLKRGG